MTSGDTLIIWKGEEQNTFAFTIRLTEKALSWYTNESGLKADGQLNNDGVTYNYYAIG